MFARKIRSVFDKLLPKQNPDEQTLCPKNATNPERKFFRIFRDNKSFWEMGAIKKRVGNMIYIIKGPQFTHKTHLNQIRKRLSDDSNPRKEKDVLDVINDTFDMSITQSTSEQHRLKRKRKMTDFTVVNPKRKRY